MLAYWTEANANQIVAALTPREPSDGGWRPIETAPKDGTEILLGAPAQVFRGQPTEPRSTIGHWMTDEECREPVGDCGGECRCPEYKFHDPYWISWDGGFTEEHPPTHWMPLPSRPVGEDIRKALFDPTQDDASLNLQGALDDLLGRFDPKDGGVIAGTVERVIGQLEAARRLLRSRPVGEGGVDIREALRQRAVTVFQTYARCLVDVIGSDERNYIGLVEEFDQNIREAFWADL
jgi:hypothetical protein